MYSCKYRNLPLASSLRSQCTYDGSLSATVPGICLDGFTRVISILRRGGIGKYLFYPELPCGNERSSGVENGGGRSEVDQKWTRKQKRQPVKVGVFA